MYACMQVTNDAGMRCITLQARYAASAAGGPAATAGLLPRTPWHVTTLYSLVPHFREFQVRRGAAQRGDDGDGDGDGAEQSSKWLGLGQCSHPLYGSHVRRRCRWRAVPWLYSSPVGFTQTCPSRMLQALCNVYRLPESTLRFLLSPSSPPAAGATAAASSSTAGQPSASSQQGPPGGGPALAKAPPRPMGQCWQRATMPPPLRAALQAAYNGSQLDAIAACLEGGGQFTLVQGPPGTGKTSAIRGIASVLLCRKAIQEYAAGAGAGGSAGGGGGLAASGSGRHLRQPASWGSVLAEQGAAQCRAEMCIHVRA